LPPDGDQRAISRISRNVSSLTGSAVKARVEIRPLIASATFMRLFP